MLVAVAVLSSTAHAEAPERCGLKFPASETELGTLLVLREKDGGIVRRDRR